IAAHVGPARISAWREHTARRLRPRSRRRCASERPGHSSPVARARRSRAGSKRSRSASPRPVAPAPRFRRRSRGAPARGGAPGSRRVVCGAARARAAFASTSSRNGRRCWTRRCRRAMRWQGGHVGGRSHHRRRHVRARHGAAAGGRWSRGDRRRAGRRAAARLPAGGVGSLGAPGRRAVPAAAQLHARAATPPRERAARRPGRAPARRRQPVRHAESAAAVLHRSVATADRRMLWTYTARRPVGEWAFANAARDEPGVAIRRGGRVAGLLTGPAPIGGVPHVVGVRTADGEVLKADIVIDAMGRRSKSPEWLTALGARPVYEEQADCGFSYYTRYFSGSEPQRIGPVFMVLGTIAILTLPGDNGTWSVTIMPSAGDQPLKALRHVEHWTKVVGACPLQAHWLDGEPITDILAMSGIVDRYRRFVVDGTPVVTGF